MTAEFEYRVLAPTGELARFVSEVWFARGTIRGARERITPTGSAVLGIVLGDPIAQVPRDGAGDAFEARTGFLIGPHDQPIINEPLGETWAVGVVTTPVGCRAAFGVAPAPIRGRIVNASAWSAFETLRESLLHSPDATSALAAAERALHSTLDTHEPGLTRVEAAVASLTADPARPIASIAAELDVSHGHLDREFRRIVGMGPRVLARVLRLRRLLDSIDVYGQVAWTRLAAELGWFDQAHLVRDFRRFTGTTPSEYAAAQRAVYSPADAQPGFVPEL
jgi:AraC-like DNA-binding protein